MADNPYSRRIDARPRNVAYLPGTGPGTGRTARRTMGSFGGVNNYHALQDRSRPAFADHTGVLGLGNSAEEEGRVSTNLGLMYNPRMGGYVNDTMYNRTAGYGYNPGGRQARPQQMRPTEPQLRWAERARAKQAGTGKLDRVAEKVASAVGGGAGGGVMGALGAALGGMAKRGGGKGGRGRGGVTDQQSPYLMRQQNIRNAKDADEFDKIRAEYNSRGGSMVMDEEGNITQDPKAFARIKAEERALMRGSPVTKQTLSDDEISSGAVSKTAVESQYGRGSRVDHKDPSKKPKTMVKDDFGKMVPMSDYLQRKRYVQGTKGMNPYAPNATPAPRSNIPTVAASRPITMPTVRNNSVITGRPMPVARNNSVTIGELLPMPVRMKSRK